MAIPFEAVTVGDKELDFLEVEKSEEGNPVGLLKAELAQYDIKQLDKAFKKANGNANVDTVLKGFKMDTTRSAYDTYKGIFRDLEELRSRVPADMDAMNEKVSSLQTTVAGKAEKADLDAKADKADVDSKADQSTVDALETRVATLETSAS